MNSKVVRRLESILGKLEARSQRRLSEEGDSKLAKEMAALARKEGDKFHKAQWGFANNFGGPQAWSTSLQSIAHLLTVIEDPNSDPKKADYLKSSVDEEVSELRSQLQKDKATLDGMKKMIPEFEHIIGKLDSFLKAF